MGKNILNPAYGTNLEGLNDVDTTGLQNGFQLYWDESQGKWVVRASDGGFRGTYANPTDLNNAVPAGVNGDWAIVTSTNTIWVWSGGGWVDSGSSTLGDMNTAVYDPQNIASDAFARANHTGFQAISTITGLQTALDSKVVSVTAADGTVTIGGTSTAPTIRVSDVVINDIASKVASISAADASITLGGTSTNPTIQVSAALQSTIASAIQPGANISVFTNDANYVAAGANISVFTNDAGYVNAAGASAAAPIQSISGTSPVLVSSPTGTPVISLSVSFVGLVNSAVQPGDNVSVLTNNAGYLTAADVLVRASNIDLTQYTTTSASFVNAGGGTSFPVVNGRTYIIECHAKGTETNAIFSSNEHESRLLVNGVQVGGDEYINSGNDAGLREPVVHVARYTATSTGNITVQLQHARAASGTTYTRDIIYKIMQEIG